SNACILGIGDHLSILLGELLEGLAALTREILGQSQLANPCECRLDHIVRVVRAQALGEDVANAGEFHHGTHATPRNDAGTVGSRLEQHPPRPEDAGDLEGDRALDHWYRNEAPLGTLDSFAN